MLTVAGVSDKVLFRVSASVRLDEPSDIAYLTRLAREEPGLYAKLASRDGGLQGYVEAMGEFN